MSWPWLSVEQSSFSQRQKRKDAICNARIVTHPPAGFKSQCTWLCPYCIPHSPWPKVCMHQVRCKEGHLLFPLWSFPTFTAHLLDDGKWQVCGHVCRGTVIFKSLGAFEQTAQLPRTGLPVRINVSAITSQKLAFVPTWGKHGNVCVPEERVSCNTFFYNSYRKQKQHLCAPGHHYDLIRKNFTITKAICLLKSEERKSLPRFHCVLYHKMYVLFRRDKICFWSKLPSFLFLCNLCNYSWINLFLK